MTGIPEDLRYTKKHEWARLEGNRIVVGITDFAQSELTDIVYVEMPREEEHVDAGDEIAVVESVKAVSEIYAPLAGNVVEYNTALEERPETINKDPYGDGWIAVIEVDNPDEFGNLLSAEDYARILEE
ncbi:MAG: glycine cleavage system protein GcvH [Thermoplasmata archaeon]